MPWTGPAYLRWFEGFYGTADAARLVRSVAARHDVSSFADDLHQSWYLSIRGTVDRLLVAGGSLPTWLDHEDAAIRYAVRALHNDATDLTRVQRRERSRTIDLDDERGGMTDLADRSVEPGIEAAASVALEAIRRELVRRHRTRELGCASCRNDLVASLALAVVERLTDVSNSPDRDGSGPAVSGGTTEWDKVVYEALGTIDPDRFASVDGRKSAAARQMKARCGGRVREVLQELFLEHYSGIDTGIDAGAETR